MPDQAKGSRKESGALSLPNGRPHGTVYPHHRLEQVEAKIMPANPACNIKRLGFHGRGVATGSVCLNTGRIGATG
ncbi:MAG: hypothetical protein V6Z86_09685 [Hyphomicrobiales bacterium]